MKDSRTLCLLTSLAITIVLGCGDAPETRVDSSSKLLPDRLKLINGERTADSLIRGELGGRGFTGVGWQTNTLFSPIGDPRALKGGVLRYAIPDFPSTLRPEGPETGVFNLVLTNLVYETLLLVHPTSTDYI